MSGDFRAWGFGDKGRGAAESDASVEGRRLHSVLWRSARLRDVPAAERVPVCSRSFAAGEMRTARRIPSRQVSSSGSQADTSRLGSARHQRRAHASQPAANRARHRGPSTSSRDCETRGEGTGGGGAPHRAPLSGLPVAPVRDSCRGEGSLVWAPRARHTGADGGRYARRNVASPASPVLDGESPQEVPGAARSGLLATRRVREAPVGARRARTDSFLEALNCPRTQLPTSAGALSLGADSTATRLCRREKEDTSTLGQGHELSCGGDGRASGDVAGEEKQRGSGRLAGATEVNAGGVPSGWRRVLVSVWPLLFVFSLVAIALPDGAHALMRDSRGAASFASFTSTHSTSRVLRPLHLSAESGCQWSVASSVFAPESGASVPAQCRQLSRGVGFLSSGQTPELQASRVYNASAAVPAQACTRSGSAAAFSCFLSSPISFGLSVPTALAPVRVASAARRDPRGVVLAERRESPRDTPFSSDLSGATPAALQAAASRAQSSEDDAPVARTQKEWVEELTAALQSGALKLPTLTEEVTKAARGRPITPHGLDDLIEAAAAVRAGLPLPSHLIPSEGDEDSKDDAADSTQETKKGKKPAETRSPNEGKRSVAAYADEARQLQANLDGASEEKKQFFLNAYRRELRHRGVDDADCQTAHDLCNRLAFARVFSSSQDRKSSSKAGKDASGTGKAVRAEVTEAGRSRKSRRSRTRRLLPRLSEDDEDEEGGDAEGDDASGIVQISPGVFMARGGSFGSGSPFDRLFADVFGGSFFGGRPGEQEEEADEGDSGVSRRRGARGGSLFDHLFGGDVFSSLLGGGLMGGGQQHDEEDDEGSARSRVKKLDFKAPESLEKTAENGAAEDDPPADETDPRLLQLLNKAQSRGDPSLVLFLRKSFQDTTLRELLLEAQTAGVAAAEAKADGRGRYVLQRLRDNQVLS
ncbi:hypothetical protein BESB_013590 [Besnoitia besnoiti]|uniref:Uncharacterized protein n=1 Tax=Besnoitia besnoiti TaxID=94643 RepID=A0A2A9MAU7_BESBE|nr:hypothetical protein BESB_013590 [Besnoitia besnoiti]PFH32747.1 hypothetical protein BESB_013590 [Besnoitia besnoiti]